MGINNLVGVKITPGWCDGQMNGVYQNELECWEREKKHKKQSLSMDLDTPFNIIVYFRYISFYQFIHAM